MIIHMRLLVPTIKRNKATLPQPTLPQRQQLPSPPGSSASAIGTQLAVAAPRPHQHANKGATFCLHSPCIIEPAAPVNRYLGRAATAVNYLMSSSSNRLPVFNTPFSLGGCLLMSVVIEQGVLGQLLIAIEQMARTLFLLGGHLLI